MKTWAKLLFALLLLCRSSHAQGFINLDFEQATIVADTEPSADPRYAVVTSNAIPGWSVYYNGNPSPVSWIVYNSVSLGSASVDLEATNGVFIPVPQVQGKYYIYLQGSSFVPPGASAAIGQTGQIPSTAQSISFWGNDVLNITFAGQTLAFNQTGSTANYNIYTADISAYAGQTGQLLFTAGAGTGGYFDNIQFSSSTVPEPRGLALAGLGACGLVSAAGGKLRKTKI